MQVRSAKSGKGGMMNLNLAIIGMAMQSTEKQLKNWMQNNFIPIRPRITQSALS